MKITRSRLRNIINEEIRRLTEDQLPGGIPGVPSDVPVSIPEVPENVRTAAGELAAAVADINFTDPVTLFRLAAVAQDLMRDAPQIAECLQALQDGSMDLSLGVTCLDLLRRWQGTLGDILPGQEENIATIVTWVVTVVQSSDGE